MCELTGFTHEELVGRSISTGLFTPESLAETPLRFDLLEKGETVVSERHIRRKDGTTVCIEMRTKMMPDGTYQSIYRDITERKTTETLLLHFTDTLTRRVEERTLTLEATNATLQKSLQQLQASQTLLSEMGRMAQVGAWELDLHTGKQSWTEEVYHIHEVDLDFNPTKENGIAFYEAADRPLIERAVRLCIEQGVPYDMELRFITAKGRARWVRAIGKADHEHARLFGTFQDVTERRLVQTELQGKVSQLRKLAMELTQAEEHERRRLAVKLHDEVQQSLAAATMKVSLLDRKAPARTHARIVQEVLNLLAEALNSSRSLAVDLFPPVLMEGGLSPSLHWLADRMKERHGLTVELAGQEFRDIPAPLSVLLFQGVRELLFNVVKHACVKTATVTMGQPDPKTIQIAVNDHGTGFSNTTATAFCSSSGIGMFHLRERLACIGGSLEIESSPGQGAKVVIMAPLG